MPAYNLASMRTAIDPTAFPAGADNTAKNNLINKVREMFYFTPLVDEMDVVWKGTEIALQLNIFTNIDGSHCLALPRGVETLIGAYDCNGSRIIQNQWFAYLNQNQWGGWSGPRPTTDLGDGWCGAIDIPSAGAQLQIQTTVNEVAALTVYIAGNDISGNPINETLAIPTVSGNTATSVNTYYAITQITKLPTSGNIKASLLSSATLYFYAIYQPSETIPNYRRYSFTPIPNETTIMAICKRRYEVLLSDNDPIESGSVLAFETGLRAYQWLKNAEMSAYRDALRESINFLNAELGRFQSDSEAGTVQMQKPVAAGSMWNAY